MVRGFVGIEVVSLRITRQMMDSMRHARGGGKRIHKIILEEVLQLSLSGRVREVPNVEPPAFSSRRSDSLILGGARGVVASRRTLGGRGIGQASGGHLGSGSFNGHGA